MKIDHRQPSFANYRVERTSWWRKLFSRTEVKNVILADDATKQVIRQVENKKGELLWINEGGDEVAMSDTIKVLMLQPDIRVFFLREFSPKTETVYMKDVKIVRVGDTEVIRVPVPQEQDGESFVMQGGYEGQ